MSVAKIFERIDKNKDGKISWDEFAEAIRVFTPSVTSEELDKMFSVLDVDGDGQIDAEEFASCLMLDGDGGEKEEDDEETVLKKAFDLYDMDGDGKISAGELHVVLKRLQEKHTMEECVVMVQAVDADGDGFVDFEEFKTMMTSNNSQDSL